jgi:hypothetical protein
MSKMPAAPTKAQAEAKVLNILANAKPDSKVAQLVKTNPLAKAIVAQSLKDAGLPVPANLTKGAMPLNSTSAKVALAKIVPKLAPKQAAGPPPKFVDASSFGMQHSASGIVGGGGGLGDRRK